MQVESTRDITQYVAALGTEELQEAQQDASLVEQMKLFPNPTQDQVYVVFEQALPQDYQWRVVDLRGITLLEGQLPEGQTQIEFSSLDWPSGLYFFVIGDQRFTVHRKIVVQGH